MNTTRERTAVSQPLTRHVPKQADRYTYLDNIEELVETMTTDELHRAYQHMRTIVAGREQKVSADGWGHCGICGAPRVTCCC